MMRRTVSQATGNNRTRSAKVPVLIITFNRPDLLKNLLQLVKDYDPDELYIAIDGPRHEIDVQLINKSKAIIGEYEDYFHQVHYLVRDRNLGCKWAVSTAIDWFFRCVDRGIILEDDLSVDPTFFYYCEELLKEYAEDDRILHISGFNPLEKWKEDIADYHFAYFGSIWGWATWRRAWKNYDVNMRFWNSAYHQNRFRSLIGAEENFEFRKQMYAATFGGSIDTWDFQWTFARVLVSGLSIIPSVNLVKNDGFRSDATHTTGSDNRYSSTAIYRLNSGLKRNPLVSVDHDYDLAFTKYSSNK